MIQSPPSLSDARFGASHAEAFLDRVPADERLVVVGGQAVNLWARYYRDIEPELRAHEPYASKDLDVVGSADSMYRIQRLLGARLVRPSEDEVLGVSMHGVIEFDTSEGPMHVDFLAGLCGLTADEVRRTAVPYETGAGTVGFVLHPLLCIRSRAENIVHVPEKYAFDHGLRQLRASVLVCRAFIEEIASGRPRHALKLIEQHHAYCLGDTARLAHQRHAIELFDAVRPHPRLPDMFRTRRYPQMLEELKRHR